MPDKQQQGPEYDLEYFDFRYADDARAKLAVRQQGGWKVNTATIGYPYLHVLWERPPQAGGSG